MSDDTTNTMKSPHSHPNSGLIKRILSSGARVFTTEPGWDMLRDVAKGDVADVILHLGQTIVDQYREVDKAKAEAEFHEESASLAHETLWEAGAEIMALRDAKAKLEKDLAEATAQVEKLQARNNAVWADYYKAIEERDSARAERDTAVWTKILAELPLESADNPLVDHIATLMNFRKDYSRDDFSPVSVTHTDYTPYETVEPTFSVSEFTDLMKAIYGVEQMYDAARKLQSAAFDKRLYRDHEDDTDDTNATPNTNTNTNTNTTTGPKVAGDGKP